ncbi:uncharacterized protein LOC129910610 [Episyrphus balteatus]|uniref:uncharacterized protein LOC129910610 n=1 Tax=Episyrphus balteatus TaxID=286459 RepID=UPI002486B857|nr:uncharacterized protein LOC129910610 [Episyrphus balteatus]
MSLPPALLKRLASRGLVKGGSVSDDSGQIESKAEEVLENEEIIAEDYDEIDIEYPSQFDTYEPERRIEENFWIERMKLRIGDGNQSGYKGCPNKYNIYHKCSLFCVTRWGNGILEPEKGYLKRRARLNRKYPLPKGWKELYDSGCGVFYYWNTGNNMVSWLPPTHPKATITKSAAVFRRQLEEMVPLESDDGADDKIDSEGGSRSADPDETNVMPLDAPSSKIDRLKSDFRSQHVLGPKKHRNRDLDKMIRQKEIKRYRDKMLRKESHRDSHRKGDLPKPMGEYSDKGSTSQ